MAMGWLSRRRHPGLFPLASGRRRRTALLATLALAGGLLVVGLGPGSSVSRANDIPTSNVLRYGNTGDATVAGRWNGADATDGVGTFLDGVWYLRRDMSQGPAESIVRYGRSGDTPVVGDWNGDRVDGIGTWLNGVWYLRNRATEGAVETVIRYGNPGDQVVTGDWDGDGTDGIGTFLGGMWYLRNSPTPGPPDIVLRYGNPGDQVVTGDWDGDGTDGIGTFLGGIWYLRNSPTEGPTDRVMNYGRPGDRAMASDWDGDGTDGISTYLGGAWYLSETKQGGLLYGLEVAPLSLLPGFRSRAHDYAIQCAAGTNRVDLQATGTSGTRIRVAGRSSNDTWSGRVTVAPDEAIVIEVSKGALTEQYWVRCLPPGFPVIDVLRPQETTPGYYLLDNGVLGAQTYWVIMLDSFGAPVWYKEAGRRVDIKAMPGGLIGMLPNSFTNANEFEIRDLDGNRVSGVKYIDQDPETNGVTDMHDAIVLSNGNYLLMSYTNRTVPGAAATFGITCGDGNTVYDLTIQEVTPANVPVWTWNSFDHFALAETTSPTCWNAMPVPDPGNDIIHANSFEELDDGDILVSARNMNAVFRVDKPTKKVIWKIGGHNSHLNPDRPIVFSFVNDPLNGICTQHDARVLGNGNLHVFDNHGCRGTADARAVEYRLDAQAATATMVRQFRSDPPYFSPFVGNARRQPDGATVVSWGGRSNPQVTELALDGTLLFRVQLIEGQLTYRTVKVPAGTWSIDRLRATAGGRLGAVGSDQARPFAVAPNP